ncbi:hypothetical protein EIN_086840 [Entamoeba invadens IP1]|uniref:hypothetical protein n=1 Tax=Entamoeba invadens IP1 TaxID=370355 RepID=UPI0002C3F61A|nr:hypothetical protein EIN_086840 [Entamoeba invadens IP1]ELP85402.1 hypothetical protein EIN_086840 [Entamoeba invadens IP1]|eukprot:XP_004184748.1 hypothetical protein EIN_086840 [Entamoeba invadens IP1]
MKRLDGYSLMIVSKYFLEEDDFLKVIQVCKKFEETIDKFHYNPIPIIKRNIFKNMQTHYKYFPFEPQVDDDKILVNFRYPLSYREASEQKKKLNKVKRIVLKKDDIGYINTIDLKDVTEIDTECLIKTSSLVIPNNITSLYEKAFFSCLGLKEVTLSTNLSTLPFCCFANCQALSRIEIPEGITEFGPACFFGCLHMSDILLPKSLCLFGHQCFVFCAQLSTIELPDNIRSIPFKAFSGCVSLTSVVMKRVTEIDTCGFESCVSLRAINTLSTLKYIGQNAFEQCSALKEIVLSDDIINISLGAFRGVSNLTKLHLPLDQHGDYPFEIDYKTRKVLKGFDISFINLNVDGFSQNETRTMFIDSPSIMGKNCFLNNVMLNSFNIPTSIIHIGEDAFKGCTQLTSIYIPSSVTVVSSGTFKGCTKLPVVVFPSISVGVMQEDVFADCTSLSKVVLPTTLSVIRSHSFKNCVALRVLQIPNSLVKIEDGVFEGCISLTEMVFPEKMEDFGSGNFVGCTRIERLQVPLDTNGIFPYSVTEKELEIFEKNSIKVKRVILSADNILELRQKVRALYTNGIEIKLVKGLLQPNGVFDVPVGVVEIGVDCFEQSLCENIVIPNTVTSIGDFCFSKCSKLKEVTLPEHCEVGNYCFNKCNAITAIHNVTKYDGRVSYYESYFVRRCGIKCSNISVTAKEKARGVRPNELCKTIECYIPPHLVIPKSVVCLGNSVFSSRNDLTHFTLPSQITEIGKEVFCMCYNLKSVDLSFLDTIPKFCFFNCCSLTSLKLSSSLRLIKDGAFYQCGGLEHIVVPSTVTKVGGMSFYQCFSLKTVLFEKGCTLDRIESCTFYRCHNLRSITLPQCRELENLSLFKTLSLQQIEVPSSVTRIGIDCFKRCYSLTEVRLNEGLQVIDKECFMNCFGLVHIVIPQSVERINGGVFQYCKKLAEVTLPSRISQLEIGCFKGCYSLSKIVINGPIKVYPFDIDYEEAEHLKKNGILSNKITYTEADKAIFGLSIPNGVVALGANCYRDTANLVEIIIPSQITRIDSFCFKNCKSLVRVGFKGNGTIIGDNCFDGCVRLTSVIGIQNQQVGNDIFVGCPNIIANH